MLKLRAASASGAQRPAPRHVCAARAVRLSRGAMHAVGPPSNAAHHTAHCSSFPRLHSASSTVDMSLRPLQAPVDSFLGPAARAQMTGRVLCDPCGFNRYQTHLW